MSDELVTQEKQPSVIQSGILLVMQPTRFFELYRDGKISVASKVTLPVLSFLIFLLTGLVGVYRSIPYYTQYLQQYDMPIIQVMLSAAVGYIGWFVLIALVELLLLKLGSFFAKVALTWLDALCFCLLQKVPPYLLCMSLWLALSLFYEPLDRTGLMQLLLIVYTAPAIVWTTLILFKAVQVQANVSQWCALAVCTPYILFCLLYSGAVFAYQLGY